MLMANRPEIRILVTGASGFVGSHALAAFAERSLPVIAIGRNLPLQPRETETWLRADLLVRDQLKSILKDVAPTHVVHLAGGVFSSAIETIDANLTTTLNLLH
ncbi:MAG TPA: NAD-dependent epimerase/dehydratase family protein, partial [Sneathiellales bacterium]|nr:NAD-dependent epimerase/dehydratase family protein [Sneathiellales bacterium]